MLTLTKQLTKSSNTLPNSNNVDGAITRTRTVRFLSILSIYLVLVVCVQLLVILKLNSGSECENVLQKHGIVKREVGVYGNQVSGFCPPGCVRRRRRKGQSTSSPIPSSTTVGRVVFDYGYSSLGDFGPPGEAGYQGRPGFPGEVGYQGRPGLPGEVGYQGRPGLPGEVGYQGRPGLQGEAGYQGRPGLPGEAGYQGRPGLQGEAGYQGRPGLQGEAGYQGRPGLPGEAGYQGRPGLPGEAGYQGRPGFAGVPGAPGTRGMSGSHGWASGRGQADNLDESGFLGGRNSQGVRGPPGQRGHPASNNPLPEYSSNYGLRSGTSSRGDHGIEGYTPALRNTTAGANALLNEFRLYAHPECKNEVNHKALMDTLKDQGKVSFMILIDLQDNKYCIVHT